MPDLSVIIVTIKDERDIICIPEFERSDFDDYEVIIRTDKGISKARNNGVKEANGDKVVFIDDDAKPMPGYLQAASEVLEYKSVVGGKVIHPGNGTVSKLAGHYPNSDEGQYVQKVVGCNMGFRKEVFDTVGWFDEEFMWGHDESEFIDRVRKQYPIYYEPEMCVVHPFANSVPDYWNKMARLGKVDVYRDRKSGKSDLDIIRECIHPFWYVNSTPSTWPVYAIGSLYRTASRVKEIKRTR